MSPKVRRLALPYLLLASAPLAAAAPGPSFADLDPALHEPGLVWGAAKAHVFLRHRREAGQR